MKAQPKLKASHEVREGDPRFTQVIKTFLVRPGITREQRKGFGSGALKVKGKIFAMMSSKNEFVVKLPKVRVDELVSSGQGKRFNPGHGRLMKEWFVVQNEKADWLALAQEACEFVKQSRSQR